ncbi:hypothetical protein ASG89_34465 [Paenibacillus sp. Soil766]|uniref:C39 family peptidase n=1 Tax=Paenibacillus sp. Soil766 TaxID=1736404 RepID=UPI00070F537B|nr:C39 family peptidase [Paenibacillus sp. Soil766]KRE91146.1 hypothetical protein ASG89_34465 [Paenibacillus sp. Soil766]
MKRKLALLALASVLTLVTIPTIGTASTSELSASQFGQLKKNALTAAEKYVATQSNYGSYKPWSSVKISYQDPLFDFDDNLTSFIFNIKNSSGDAGYLIVSADETPVVLEAAREGNGPYTQNSKLEKEIYVGPTQYYVKADESTYFDIRKKTNVSKSSFKSKGSLNGKVKIPSTLLQNDTQLSSDVSQGAVSPQTVVSYSSKTLSNVPDFSWRDGCSPTSFSNIIWYYRYSQGYTNLLASTTTSTTLIDVLASSSYMSTDIANGGGTGWDNRVNGMKKFWSDRGYTVSVTRNSPSFSAHKTEINNNRPDIINVVGDATYGAHDMTGVGFEEYQESTENFKWYQYVIVRDTWDSTPTSVYIYLPNLAWNETVKVQP